MGPYVLDFYCPSARLAVEIDGSGHNDAERVEHDARRDAWLAQQGVRVLRIRAPDLLNDAGLRDTLATIAQAAAPSTAFGGPPPPSQATGEDVGPRAFALGHSRSVSVRNEICHASVSPCCSARTAISFEMVRSATPVEVLPDDQGAGEELISAAAEPTATGPDAEEFYAKSLHELTRTELPFLVAGTYAVSAYTGVTRPTKDLDIFCKAGDYPRILSHFRQLGFGVRINDERWLAAVFRGEHYFDVIFACSHGSMPVDEQWFEKAHRMELFGTAVRIIGPTELVWSKAFVQHRDRYDGADVAHVILKQHEKIDWRRLLDHMELHWEVLLAHIVNFRWIYPSERHLVPDWVLDELIDRVRHQVELPPSETKICRGRMFSPADYDIDIREWGFADV